MLPAGNAAFRGDESVKMASSVHFGKDGGVWPYEWTWMTILLTGAEGNFGLEFRRQAGASIRAVGRDDWATLDDALDGVKRVVHAASDLRTRAADAPASLVASNVMLTAQLLEAARRHGVRRFVFLSSCAVYGEDMRTAEESLCCPITINGVSKLLNEKLVVEFCGSNGMEFQILRVFNTYGGLDRFSILSHLEHAVRTGSVFTLNNAGLMQRDFIHVADVAAIALRLLDFDVGHHYLNIGTGNATKISTLVDIAIRRFPQLEIRHHQTQESEYSRADIGKLRQFFGQEFIGVEDYMRNCFAALP